MQLKGKENPGGWPPDYGCATMVPLAPWEGRMACRKSMINYRLSRWKQKQSIINKTGVYILICIVMNLHFCFQVCLKVSNLLEEVPIGTSKPCANHLVIGKTDQMASSGVDTDKLYRQTLLLGVLHVPLCTFFILSESLALSTRHPFGLPKSSSCLDRQ